MENRRRQIVAVLLTLLLMILAVPFIGTERNLASALESDPLVAAETKLVVYPDGRVGVEGAVDYTDMVPPYTGPPVRGSFNLTSNQASAGLTVDLPDEFPYNEFPFNSTTVDMFIGYSDGLLDQSITSTMFLPPEAQSLYPFNSTDGTVEVTYFDGILYFEVEGNTTLPSEASQEFPFNATDIIVVGTYSPNTLEGTIVFSVLPETPIDDVAVDFTGTQTDFTASGTVSVVFGIPFNGFIIQDETELIQAIEQLKRDFVGEKGIVWNMTGGLLNVTSLDISYVLDGLGADVTFEMDVEGDFVRALAYLMSGGRNEMLLSPVLNEAYESVLGGFFDIQYWHDTRVAEASLAFSYDLERLMDYILTPPTGTTPYVITSTSMSPTLLVGDVVMVEEVPNPGDIVADPETGDIIAFYHPQDTQVIIHRAINKTKVGETWYFRTKGDANYSPDYWTGDNTYEGMISENLLIGKVVLRIPFLGYMLVSSYYFYGYPYDQYLQSAVELSMSLLKAEFSAVQGMSVQMSYSSVDKRFDFQYDEIYKLKELADEIARMLPELLPPETPPELKSFVESLLNTTYASVSTAQASLSYESGTIDFKATSIIEGDLNAELNYVKDLFFQLIGASPGIIPWQVGFLNQTKIDVSNLKISGNLDETSLEGRMEGLTLMPPIDPINATHFRLERFFNLTAPQYPEQQEFPGQNQKLKITVEGGSNATHTVTIHRPSSVPEPDSVRDGKSMTWLNQTLSNLKDLVFETQPLGVGAIDGTVRDADTGLPIAGATVTADGYSTTTDSTGYYIITDVSAVTYTVTAEATGYYSDTKTSIAVESGVTTTVNFNLSLIVWIDGYVTDIETGAALVGATVTADGVSTTTDTDGYYKLELAPGEYTVTVSASGYAGKSKIATVTAGKAKIVSFTLAVPGVVGEEITEPDLVTADNPFVVDATEEAATSLIITQISDPVKIVVRNVTERPEGVDPPPGTWEVLGSYVQIDVNNTDVTVNATIRMYYTLERLKASGLDESTLEIRFWNATSGEWESIESHVNTAEHYVWAIIDHFSLFAILGQPIEGAALPTQLWLLPIAIIVIIAATAVSFIYFRRRKTAVTRSSQRP